MADGHPDVDLADTVGALSPEEPLPSEACGPDCPQPQRRQRKSHTYWCEPGASLLEDEDDSEEEEEKDEEEASRAVGGSPVQFLAAAPSDPGRPPAAAGAEEAAVAAAPGEEEPGVLAAMAGFKVLHRRTKRGARAVTLPDEQPSRPRSQAMDQALSTAKRGRRRLRFRLEPLHTFKSEGKQQTAMTTPAKTIRVVPSAAGPTVRAATSAVGLGLAAVLCSSTLLLVRGRRGPSLADEFQVDADRDGQVSWSEAASTSALVLAIVAVAVGVTRTLLFAYDYAFFGLQAIRHNERFHRLQAMSPFQINRAGSAVDQGMLEYLQTHFDARPPASFAQVPPHTAPSADVGQQPTRNRAASVASTSSSRRTVLLPSPASSRRVSLRRFDTHRSCFEYMSLDGRSAAQSGSAASSSGGEEGERPSHSVSCERLHGDSQRGTSSGGLPPHLHWQLDDSSRLQELAYKLPGWDFDMFEVADATQRPLAFIGFVCLDAYSKLVDFDKKKLVEFLNDVECSYRKVPYHNSLHGASVARGVYSFCAGCGLAFTQEYMEFTIVLAGLVHDVHHPGLTPAFLSKASVDGPWKSAVTAPLEPADMDLSPKYNDQSPLENMHCATTFELLRCEKNAFLSREDVATMRKPLIRAILGTDMAKHAETMTRLAALIDNLKHQGEGGAMPWYWPAKPPANADEEQRKVWERLYQEEFVMELFLHAADIGNPTLPFEQWIRWNRLVQDEFHNQGDRERAEFGDLISPPAGFDRDAGVKAEHAFTKGFMQYLALPLFEQLHELTQVVCPASVCQDVKISGCVENLRNNLQLWDSYVPREDVFELHTEEEGEEAEEEEDQVDEEEEEDWEPEVAGGSS